MTFDYVFPVKGATSMNVLGTRPPASAIRCPFVDPMLLDDQALSSSAIRNSVRDNSTQWQQMDNDMMQYEEYPWNSRDIFEAMGGTKVSYHGEHSMMQQRSSLAHKDIVFPSTQIPSSSQSGQRVYLSQFDTSRRPHPSRMMTDLRGWLPSLDYDSNGNISSRALGAPMLPLPASARSGSSYVKDQLQLNQERKRPAPSSDSRKDEGISKKAHCSRSPMAGEHRIKISFIELGTLGEAPQYFGAKGYIIPNGLTGTHQVYQQRWQFDTRHVKIDNIICVSLSITNLASGTMWQRTETPREAQIRENLGHTICNQLLRHALISRAAELETKMLSLHDNTAEFSKTENMIKALKPKSCILGLLFFGLLHDTVQQHMRNLLGNIKPLHHLVPGDLLSEAGDEVDCKCTASPTGSGGELGSS